MRATTAAALGLAADERRALKAAGLVPSDLLHMNAMDLVAATEEAIDDERARDLVDIASLVAAGIGKGFSRTLVARGIRGRADLASRSAEDLFVELLDTTARTHPMSYDHFALCIYLARTEKPSPRLQAIGEWTRQREERGFDPLLMYWRHRHGDDVPMPAKTGRRLRIPTLKVSAPIYTGATDRTGQLVTPLGQQDVVRNAGDPLRLLVGHWMWRGGHGAFARLEDLRPGDGLRVGDDWYAVSSVAKAPAPADLDADAEHGAIVLATPPHRRAGVIGLPESLEPVERGTLQVVVHADPATADDVDTEPRPIRRIPGAY